MKNTYSIGTQCICYGTDVGVIIDRKEGQYRVRWVDDSESWVKDTSVRARKGVQAEGLSRETVTYGDAEKLLIFECLIGSTAYGLNTEQSDIDTRSIYMPPADIQWGLFGYPDVLERKHPDSAIYELGKFLVLALKANPNLLEMLYSPSILNTTLVGRELIENKDKFLSEIIYHTYQGYSFSQFKLLERDLRNRQEIRWKHVMHLIRLLIAGTHAFNTREILVDVGPWKDKLLAIRREEVSWEEIEVWRQKLHSEFEQAFVNNKANIPKKPDFEWANQFLVDARRALV